MLKPRLAYLIRLLPALALFSCAAPQKAVVVQEPAKKKAPEPEVAQVEPSLPPTPDDGILLPPDILAMPKEEDLKASVPAQALNNTPSGTINVRPPTEPPPRQKPKTGE